jgi:hypothetical protein
MSPEDRGYYEQLAQAERLRASETSDEILARMHRALACLCEQLSQFEVGKAKVTFIVGDPESPEIAP